VNTNLINFISRVIQKSHTAICCTKY